MNKTIKDYGIILDGSIYEKYFRCGKKNCKCYENDEFKHGPYWVWSKKIEGKTVTKQLNEKQLEKVKEGLANYKRLLKDIEKAKEVCEKEVLK